ncbi:hypothetical protein [Paraburkholderia sp. BCC1885]|uniref:hypothetical protein n=1 Tax=Paraburkholderia sp. BCC1885 TaxID=2562669 RepID=UPI0011828133|nr:hypothetical protein [Paraburkholderia sp. BCC1885]
MLLPLPAATVRNLLLEYHLSLLSVRRGAGTAELLVNLARAMYLTYFLQEAGYGTPSFSQFHEAEDAMERANRWGYETGIWMLDDAGYPLFEAIVNLHDRQLAKAPAHAVLSADDRLSRFVAGSLRSPLPPAR